MNDIIWIFAKNVTFLGGRVALGVISAEYVEISVSWYNNIGL